MAARSGPGEVCLPDPADARCGSEIPGHRLSDQSRLITTTPSIPLPTAPIEKLQHQMESEGELSTAMPLQLCEVQSDAESTTKVNVHMESGFMTPKKCTSVPFCDSSYTPECDDSITPSKGMHFPDVDAARQFYEAYAHQAGFSVRVGQHKSKDGVIRGIHPPNDIRSRGKIKRIKGHGEKGAKQSKKGKKNKENATQMCENQAS